MQKLIALLFALLVPLFLFSYFASKERVREEQIDLFYDADMVDSAIVVQEFVEKLQELGYRVKTDSFVPEDINSYLISHPAALFLSIQEIDSELFALKRMDYFDVKVPVTASKGENRSINSKILRELLLESKNQERDIIRKVMRERHDIGVVSFNNLTIGVRPMPVDGVFPSLKNIRAGLYPGVFKSHLYIRQDNPPLLLKDLHTVCEDWIDRAFSLIAGGDIMLCRGTEKYLDLYGPHYPFEGIRNEITGHDVAFANLESPISNRGERFYPNKGIYFRADPSVIEGLKGCGFDILSLGNNHALDWGAVAIQDTMELLSAMGILYSGVGESWMAAFRPAVYHRNGTALAVISINDIYPFEVHNDGIRQIQTLTYDELVLKREIRNLSEKYDIIIASVHAGVEYIDSPETSKVNMMRNLVDWGVDLVVGSHPHVIQGIEVYNGGLIAYSLGNLIFDQNWSRETSLGLLLEVAFLDDRLLYHYPRVVQIEDAQATIINNQESRSILTSLAKGNGGIEYVKN